jgi:hypothetical protein
MQNKRADVCIEIAGCLIWVAPRSFGGLSPQELADVWMDVGKETTNDLIMRKALMPMSLVQEDGSIVRFVAGELSDQENEEWTARAVSTLSVPCGEILISGVLTPDFAESEFPSMELAENGGSYEFGCYFKVAPGDYQVEVFSYPPGDLAAGWGRITEPRTYGRVPGIEAEKPLEYFRRTRPHETPPPWLSEGEDDTAYVNFLVRLAKPLANQPPVKLSEEDPGVAWEFRKPARFPVGIPAELDEG